MFRLGRSQVVIGLDVGSYAVKAVALAANKERITLQGYAQSRIDKREVHEVVKLVMQQLGVKSRSLCTSVSGRSVIVRQVETPRLEGNALQQHIAHEADKYIPFGSEEVIIDAQPLADPEGQAPTANLQVMLVAVRRSFVQEHIAQLNVAGVHPEAVDVDVFALANCYEVLGPAAPPETEKKATALIDIGAAKSNIAIVLGKRLLFTREVYLAGNEISEAIARTLGSEPDEVEAVKLNPAEQLDQLLDAAQPAFEDLANEIRLSFDYVEGQFDVEVATVVLSGGTSLLPNAAGILGNLLGRPVHVFDPLAGMDLVPSKYDIHTLDANSPSLSVALGLALHGLGFQQTGLGGSQSHAWQPRANRGADVAAAPGAEPLPVQAETVVADSIQPEPAPAPPSADTGLAPSITQPMAASPPPFSSPPPFTSPPPLPTTAAVAAPVRPEPATIVVGPPPTAAALVPPPPSELVPTISGGSNESRADVNRSGLLVVLDDDQDMPALSSERIAKADTGQGTASAKRKSTTMVKIDGFADEDEGGSKSSGEVALPDLPPPKV